MNFRRSSNHTVSIKIILIKNLRNSRKCLLVLRTRRSWNGNGKDKINHNNLKKKIKDLLNHIHTS